MSEYINIVEKQQCSGCSACENICSKQAIQMKEDEEGFLLPFVDMEKCIQCGQCQVVCPKFNKVKRNKKIENCIAAYNTDDNIRFHSSSGGVFYALAEYIIEEKGVVFGAAFNKDFSVSHIFIDSINDINKLMGSKYIQSNTLKTYSEAKIFLNEGKKVLYCGTPCQIAGLKNFLKKDYDNLYTLDLVCHGVPSYKVFRKYLEELPTLKSYSFRDKEFVGWMTSTTYTTEIGEKISIDMKDDPYWKGFIPNLFLRKSCSDCEFASLERVSDITLGDFWGIELYREDLADTKGTSLVTLNSQKGEFLFNKIEKKLITHKNIPIVNACKKNWYLYKPYKSHPERNFFFNNFKYQSFSKLVNTALTNKCDVGIMSFFNGNNYGSILTAFSLSNFISELGYTVKLINYQTPHTYKYEWENKLSYNFAIKYLALTTLCLNSSDLKKLNSEINTFIVGSDQTFRNGADYFFGPNKKNDKYFYFLSFVNESKKKIAYSSSFGLKQYEGTEKEKAFVEYYLKQFDAISVREKDAVDICSNMNVSSTHVIDPVFLTSIDTWDSMISNSKMKNKNFIAHYILDKNDFTNKVLQKIQKIFNVELVDLSDRANISVEDWLYGIKNCKILIGDSFHATCFALIFGKPFLTIQNKERGNSRISSLLSIVNLENRIIFDLNDINKITEDILNTNYDLTKLKNFKNESINWLVKALEQKKENNNNNNSVLFNELFNSIEILENNQKQLNEQLCNIYNNVNLLKNKNYYYFKYYMYKTLNMLFFGALNEKKIKYKNIIRRIRNI